MAVLAVAVVSLAVPIFGLRASASSASTPPIASLASRPASSGPVAPVVEPTTTVAPQPSSDNNKIPQATLDALGIKRVPKNKLGAIRQQIAAGIAGRSNASIARPADGKISVTGRQSRRSSPPLIGQPVVLNENAALSAAVITTVGGRDTQFSEVALVADWDGREDCAVDRGVKIDDLSEVEPDIDFVLTRAAISEHTRGNGHPFFNIYYYGDSVGNLYIGIDFFGDALVDTILIINVPELVTTGTTNGFTLLNPTAGDFTDDQVTITGIAVNPVADLGDFSEGPDSNFDLCDTDAFPEARHGEVIYFSTHDTEGGASNAANQPIRTRIFAIGLFENSDALGGFVQFTNVRQLLRSQFSNVAGVAVDDDGSLYFELVNLVTLNPSTGTGSEGAAIFKATELKRTVCGDTGRINRVIPLIPTPSTITSTTALTNGSTRLTNYTGASTNFGNIVAITCGPCNVLYAAVSASNTGIQSLAQGRFKATSTFPDGLPSMVISFADCGGAFDMCSGEAVALIDPNVGGILPIADGRADGGGDFGNWRVFVVGNGPDLPSIGTNALAGNIPITQHIDMQIDFSSHSGIAVNQESTVYVISGGAPAADSGASPFVTEVLCFPDWCPMDRRADYVDYRGNSFPNPPASGGNVGDGDSDRFDHIYYQAPIDTVNLLPTGLSGLAVGFLRQTNRLVGTSPFAIPLADGSPLGVTQTVLGDDDFAGPIIFEDLDPSHQVAGGDDQNTPFRGDDNDGSGDPSLDGALEGGFEFCFGGGTTIGANCDSDGVDVWNAFFWNSNGNITFGEGDPTPSPNVLIFRAGPPRIAPAWVDLNPDTRGADFGLGPDFGTFPVMALGFANINSFKIRWINVPEFGTIGVDEVNFAQCMSSNTFSVTLYDDGTGCDENEAQAFNPANPIGNNAVPFDRQEGPTDLRYTVEPVTGTIVGCPPRNPGSGNFCFEYCRMDLLGTKDRPVLVGYTIGFRDPLNPPGLCASNLSCLAREVEQPDGHFGVIPNCDQAQVGAICPCLIGEGTEPEIYELFNTGVDAVVNSQGQVTFAKPSFDLRFEGNGDCTPLRQDENNRGKVCFYGVGCGEPPNPTCRR